MKTCQDPASDRVLQRRAARAVSVDQRQSLNLPGGRDVMVSVWEVFKNRVEKNRPLQPDTGVENRGK